MEKCFNQINIIFHYEKANVMTLLVILKARSLQMMVHSTNELLKPLIQSHQSATAPRILTLTKGY